MESCFRRAARRRHSPGETPVATRNARVKRLCSEKPVSCALNASGHAPLMRCCAGGRLEGASELRGRHPPGRVSTDATRLFKHPRRDWNLWQTLALQAKAVGSPGFAIAIWPNAGVLKDYLFCAASYGIRLKGSFGRFQPAAKARRLRDGAPGKTIDFFLTGGRASVTVFQN